MRNRIIVVIIASLLVLAVLFFWKELNTLNIHEKINDQKITNYFLIIGALGTAAALWFFFRQLIEMENARSSASRPDLFPAELTYKMEEHTMLNLTTGTLPSPFAVRQDSLQSGYYPNYINLHNIGLGAAKNIKCDWAYDLHAVNAIINGIYQPATESGFSQHFDFIPANTSIELFPPTDYLKCCGQRVNADLSDLALEEPESGRRVSKPELRLTINYQDIFNGSFNKIFAVQVNAFNDVVSLKFIEI